MKDVDGGSSRGRWGDLDIVHVIEAVLVGGVVFRDDGIVCIVVGDPATGFVWNRALDPGMGVGVGSGMVFRRDNSAINVGGV